MLNKLKNNFFLLVSTFLILYFFFNLISGQRGLISYFEKKQILYDLKKQELTKISASKEENLIKESNLSIFSQSSNTNISNVIDWTNNFPQIFVIPRTSRQVYDLVEMFNDEYMSREEEVEFDDLIIILYTNIPILKLINNHIDQMILPMYSYCLLQ